MIRNVLKIFVIIMAVCVVMILTAVLHSKSLDKQISKLEEQRTELQTIANDVIAESRHIDSQSQSDIKLLEEVFSNMFTFYNEDDFDAACEYARRHGVPELFVSSFYDKSELGSMYADAMLDILCHYESADIYLLNRNDEAAYYYADVTLNMVSYDSTFNLGIFVSLKNDGVETERITSMLYYYAT